MVNGNGTSRNPRGARRASKRPTLAPGRGTPDRMEHAAHLREVRNTAKGFRDIPANDKRPTLAARKAASAYIGNSERSAGRLYSRLAETSHPIRASGKSPGDIGTYHRARAAGVHGKGEKHPTPTNRDLIANAREARRQLGKRKAVLRQIAGR